MGVIGWEQLRREPYRLLFPLGIVFGCVGVTHWLLYAVGVADASPFYHASVQFGAYLYCFIAGFLWTALPRMAGAPAATSPELLALLGLLAAQSILLSLRKTLPAQACFAGLLVLLALFVVRRLAARKTGAEGPTEFVWIPVGIGFGLAGSGLMAAGLQGGLPAWLGTGGRVMAQQGFVLSLVVGVAGFLAPRLMGRVNPLQQAERTPQQVQRLRRMQTARHLLAACLLGASFLLEGGGFTRIAYALRAAVVTVELGWRAQWWKAPVVKDFYILLLWLSLWCVMVGLWAVACWPTHRVAMLHIVLIGGFSLMIFSVGTMVVLSHAGQATALRKPLWVLRVVLAGVIGAMAARVLADLWPAHYFILLAAAAICWLGVGISWFVFIVPWVLRTAPDGAFERLHEEAKHRMLRERDC